MKRRVRDALASTFETYRFERRLHDVPPHEVWEVRVDGARAVCKYDTGSTGSAGAEGRTMAFDDGDDDSRRAFRDGYESVRDLPGDLDRRRRQYELLALVYYLESLYVQDQHDADATAERAAWFRDAIADALDALD